LSLKSYGESYLGTANFLNLVFLITLPPKMIATTYKWAVSMCLDVSYNLCSKMGSKLIF
jgi:hypothetical protein